LNKINNYKISLYILGWILLWASLNVDFFRIYNFGNSSVDNINAIRALIPTFILFFLFFYLLFSNLFKNFFSKKNFYLIFLFFFTCQIIGSIGNINNILIINKYIGIQAFGLIIASIASIAFIYLLHNEKNKQLEKYLIYTSIIILSFYFIPILVNLMWKYSLSVNIYAYHEQLIQESNQDFLKLPISRSTGISRSTIIITIFLFCFNSFKSNKIKILINFVIFILTTAVFLINSKFAIISIIIIYTLIILTNSLYRKHKKKFIVLFIIFPFFFSQLIFNVKYKFYFDNKTSYSISNLNIKTISNLNIKNRLVEGFYDKNAGITSGRTDIWIKSMDIYISEKKFFFGLGAQADRLYLSKIKDILSSNSSNAILYSLLSGGLISLLLLILFNYILLKRVYKFFFFKSKKINIEYKLVNFSIFVYLLLLLRSLVENSFTLFSIDFLIYLQCSMIIIKKINLKYKKLFI
jgi:hypothetical protein